MRIQINFLIGILLFAFGCNNGETEHSELFLWYDQPAANWNEALPVGNGRLGAMVFGGVETERIQFNEETLWDGEPHDYSHPGAHEYLDELRQLVFDGKQEQAHKLGMEKFMSVPLRQKKYQPFGDLYLSFPGHQKFSHYRRSLDLNRSASLTRYEVDGVRYEREVIASYPGQLIAVHLTTDHNKALDFSYYFDSPHRQKELFLLDGKLSMKVAVANSVLTGVARVVLETDGTINASREKVTVSGASSATLYLNAATSFRNHKDVSNDPEKEVEKHLSGLEGISWKEFRQEHTRDYQSLFNRFSLKLGNISRDTLPTDARLHAYQKSPEDPALLALYVQYGRYLMISSSREDTYPANLQGIWNQELEPPWDSKYTVNINTEMNYWPAEVSNLSDCHDPLFNMVEECVESGRITARNHYGCEGWVLHHNTDLWRGTAPINNSNHGIWVSGSGWLTLHLWEHYLFTRDEDFLRERAYPVMREAALFYSQYLIRDPASTQAFISDLMIWWSIAGPATSPPFSGEFDGVLISQSVSGSRMRYWE